MGESRQFNVRHFLQTLLHPYISARDGTHRFYCVRLLDRVLPRPILSNYFCSPDLILAARWELSTAIWDTIHLAVVLAVSE